MKTTKLLPAFIAKCIIDEQNNVDIEWFNFRAQSGDIKLEIETTDFKLTLTVGYKSTDLNRPIIYEGIITFADSDFEMKGTEIKEINLTDNILNQLAAFIEESVPA